VGARKRRGARKARWNKTCRNEKFRGVWKAAEDALRKKKKGARGDRGLVKKEKGGGASREEGRRKMLGEELAKEKKKPHEKRGGGPGKTNDFRKGKNVEEKKTARRGARP